MSCLYCIKFGLNFTLLISTISLSGQSAMKVTALLLVAFCASLSVGSPTQMTAKDVASCYEKALIRLRMFLSDGNKITGLPISQFEIQNNIMTLDYSVDDNKKFFTATVAKDFTLPDRLVPEVQPLLREVKDEMFPDASLAIWPPDEDEDEDKAKMTAYLSGIGSYRFVFSFLVSKAPPSSLLLRLLMARLLE